MSISAPLILSKRHKQQLATDLNEKASSAVSNFAKKQLEKFGWKDGMGLGKHNDGRSSHITVSKKEDVEGIGFKEAQRTEWSDQWWFRSYSGSSLKNIGHSSSEDSDDSDSESEVEETNTPIKRKHGLHTIPTDEELFAACGGARLGMRARAEQRGKWTRAEIEWEMKTSVTSGTSTSLSDATQNLNSLRTSISSVSDQTSTHDVKSINENKLSKEKKDKKKSSKGKKEKKTKSAKRSRNQKDESDTTAQDTTAQSIPTKKDKSNKKIKLSKKDKKSKKEKSKHSKREKNSTDSVSSKKMRL